MENLHPYEDIFCRLREHKGKFKLINNQLIRLFVVNEFTQCRFALCPVEVGVDRHNNVEAVEHARKFLKMTTDQAHFFVDAADSRKMSDLNKRLIRFLVRGK